LPRHDRHPPRAPSRPLRPYRAEEGLVRRPALGLAAAAALGWPLVAPKYLVFLATLVAVNAVVAIGLNLLSGYTNQLSFGHAGLRVPLARLGPWTLDTDTARYYLAVAVTAAMILAALNIAATRTGRAFLAIRTSEIAAQASGINAAAYKTIAFVLSAFYTGVAGGLFAFVVGFLSPDAFDVFLSVDFLVMIILGGLGSVLGSVAGAAIVTVLNDSLPGFQAFRPLIFGAIMIIRILFLPGGLAPMNTGQ